MTRFNERTDDVAAKGPSRPVGEQRGGNTKPGWILISMVALSAVITLVPAIGFSAFAMKHGLSPIGIAETMIGGINWFMLLMLLPNMLLLLMCAVFMVAFALRAPWGPLTVSVLALAWTVTGTVARVAIPMMAMPGGVPEITMIGTAPSLLAPFIGTFGLIGFLTTGLRPRAWFAPKRLEAMR